MQDYGLKGTITKKIRPEGPQIGTIRTVFTILGKSLKNHVVKKAIKIKFWVFQIFIEDLLVSIEDSTVVSTKNGKKISVKKFGLRSVLNLDIWAF